MLGIVWYGTEPPRKLIWRESAFIKKEQEDAYSRPQHPMELQAYGILKFLTVISLYAREVILHALSTPLSKHHDPHQHVTRNASSFVIPIHHLSLNKKNPSYEGPKEQSTSTTSEEIRPRDI